MTQYLENMKIGDTILFRGPRGRLFYNEPGTRSCSVASHSWEIAPVVFLSPRAHGFVLPVFRHSFTQCTYSDFCHCSNLLHTYVLIPASAQMYEWCPLMRTMQGVHTNRFTQLLHLLVHSPLPWGGSKRLRVHFSLPKKRPSYPLPGLDFHSTGCCTRGSLWSSCVRMAWDATTCPLAEPAS